MLDMMFPAKFKFCKLSQLRSGSILEILFADKLSTERSRRDAKGAKLVILFPERSSLSKFTHSPMHPRSCIPRPRNLRNSIDSKSNSPVCDLSSAAVIFSQSASRVPLVVGVSRLRWSAARGADLCALLGLRCQPPLTQLDTAL